MSIFAISDLHLSFHKPKSMDIFGEAWKDHHLKVAANWDRMVSGDDVVLVVGDLSWAVRFTEAAPDIAFLAERPGRKILIRGNHDYWWRREATNRLNSLLPEGVELLQGHAVTIGDCAITGTRGWRQEEEENEAGDEKVLARELRLLERGCLEMLQDASRRIAAIHYPPFDTSLRPNDFDALARRHGVDTIVYGHIHGGLSLNGMHDGVQYHLVSVDHTGFAPVLITWNTSP